MQYSRFFPGFIILAFLSACAATQPARDVQPSGFLGSDAALLHKGGEGEAPWFIVSLM